MSENIGFIGAGNMALAIIKGLIDSGQEPKTIWASDRDEQKLNQLNQAYAIHTDLNNNSISTKCRTLILAVKPQNMQEVCEQMKNHVENDSLIISIAAGIRLAKIHDWLGQQNVEIIRCMPNTPAMLGCGATGFYTADETSEASRKKAENIFKNTGEFIWVDTEDKINIVTALSGSGPAYFYLFTEYLITAAENLGLNHEQASKLAIQTLYGAGKMAKSNEQDIATLRRQVTSPGGTTERAIQSFDSNNINQIIEQAVNSAYQRSIVLSK